MPYANEHAARIHSHSRYLKLRRENDKLGKGIDVLWGIKRSGKTDMQAIRFSAEKFTVSEAKKWLKDHAIDYLRFEPARSAVKKNAMAVPPALLKPFSWQAPGGKQRGTFRPNPEHKIYFGYREAQHRYELAPRGNPIKWTGGEVTYSANLFVGFSVGNCPRWTMADLVKLVKQVRRRQVKHPDSSFIYQKGVYTHESDGTVVTEDAAQVVLLNVPPMLKKFNTFRNHMIRLAETICRKFHQETVIVRIDKNGIAQETIGVVA